MEKIGLVDLNVVKSKTSAANQSHRFEVAPVSRLQRSLIPTTPVTSTHILGAMNFGSSLDSQTQATYPCANVRMFHAQDNAENSDTDSTDNALTEYWTCSAPVKYESSGQWQVALSEDYLFATIQYTDHDVDLTALTQQHYAELFNLLKNKGFKQLLRIWNFVPLINKEDANGLERYRSFCLGRALAFGEQNKNRHLQMPAATGIGTHTGKNTVVVLATRESNGVTHLENPLQIPAYQYPKQYGPKPPSFARGTSYVCALDNSHTVYISGTASITASETVNKGDVAAQLDTTFANMAMLVSEHNLNAHNLNAGFTLQDMRSVKVYFRHRDDLDIIKRGCEKVFSGLSDVVYLHTEICRHDLDVEIEGYIRLSAEAG